jgi:catechol 2,3-dioxygenase-like lactoylglutathione lyase family enzyme
VERQLVVEIFVRDLDRALAFYAGLGFVLRRRTGGFAVLEWEGHELFLDERPGTAVPAVPAANVRVMVPDVDAHWHRAVAVGLPILAPIADRAYGLRDFTVADPDGFGVRFASLCPAHPPPPAPHPRGEGG